MAGDGATTLSMEQLAMFFQRLRRYGTVMFAVLLQDMRTRFGGSYLGFMVAIAWPLSHLAALVAIRSVLSPFVPIGDNPAVFFGSGILPYILCMYPARMMALAVVQNKNLLVIPPITPMHLISARAALEVLSSILVCAIFYFLLELGGIDFMPADIYGGALAVLASIYLGITVGFVNVINISIFGTLYIVFFVLLMVFLFVSSGVYIPVYVLTGWQRDLIELNPLFHLVNWFRAAYYVDASAIPVDKFYVWATGTVCLFIGLVGERFLRGKILGS